MTNKNSLTLLILSFWVAFFSTGCKKLLEEKPFSEAAPNTLLTSEEGIKAALYGAYASSSLYIGNAGLFPRAIEEWTTDIEWSTGGFVNAGFNLLNAFTFDAAFSWWDTYMWPRAFAAIRNANVVIDNQKNIPDDVRNLYVAEARFIRARMYIQLYSWFGPLMIRKSNNDELQLPRASEEEMKLFIEKELIDVIKILPNRGNEEIYGRATKGAAMAFLCKFYLNTKQWQKVITISQDIMQLGSYSLFPIYGDMFKVQNDGNREMLWAEVTIPSLNLGCQLQNGWFPPAISRDPISGFVWTSTMANFAVQYRLKDSFFNSFENGDIRKNSILTSYVNLQGQTVSLLNNDNTRSFKHFPDRNAIGSDHGNDIPIIRYADILLSRAEALNELNGPSQEAIDLINLVRRRANLGDLILSNFTKNTLRDHILKERGWEFYAENKRREDLIRHDKFVEFALARGATNVRAYHTRFPIPQSEIDANKNCTQNPGY